MFFCGGMPGKGRANVYAVAAELDAWLSSSPVPETESLAEPDLAFEDLPAADPHPERDLPFRFPFEGAVGCKRGSDGVPTPVV